MKLFKAKSRKNTGGAPYITIPRGAKIKSTQHVSSLEEALPVVTSIWCEATGVSSIEELPTVESIYNNHRDFNGYALLDYAQYELDCTKNSDESIVYKTPYFGNTCKVTPISIVIIEDTVFYLVTCTFVIQV